LDQNTLLIAVTVGVLILTALPSLLVALVVRALNKSDKAQADARDKLEQRVERLEREKADKEDMEKQFGRGSEKFDKILGALEGIRMDLHAALENRPTRDEVLKLLEGRTRG
jgi:exonuclease VII small subunit